eukprot:g6969.t1 g6969   contig23:1595793-1596757(-)
MTYPTPEFLVHLHSMLKDPSLSKIIEWEVPIQNEHDFLGGGMKGVGKIVVNDPAELQASVLGKYYRRANYDSFQRQLNYFGFHKKLHGGKRSKFSPCSYVHKKLGRNVGSLLDLRRHPPSRASSRVSTKKSSTKDPVQEQGKQEKSFSSTSIQVKAEEYEAPRTKESLSSLLHESRRSTFNVSKSSPSPRELLLSRIGHSASTTSSQRYYYESETLSSRSNNVKTNVLKASPVPSPTEVLSTSLPPAEELFDDVKFSYDSDEESGEGLWIADTGKSQSHNNLVDLAMLY